MFISLFRFRSSFTFVDGMTLHDLETVNVYNLEEYFKTQKEMKENVQALEQLRIIGPKWLEKVKNSTAILESDPITEMIHRVTNIGHGFINKSFNFLQKILIVIIAMYLLIIFAQFLLMKLFNTCSSFLSCNKM